MHEGSAAQGDCLSDGGKVRSRSSKERRRGRRAYLAAQRRGLRIGAALHGLLDIGLDVASDGHAFVLPHFGQNLSPGSRAVPHSVQKLPAACPLP